MYPKLSHSVTTFLGIALLPLFLASAPAHAQEHWQHGEHAKVCEGRDGQTWVKQRIEKEASILEIKPSQQTAWEEYAAVKLEIASSFAKGMHSPATESQEASGVLRQRADHMAEAAKNLTKLADATEKLQAVLSPEQRIVLKRLVTEHGFHHHFSHAHGVGHGMMRHDVAQTPAGKSQPQKTK